MSGPSKGSTFERKICRRLSLWISKGKDEDVFWRSSTSGARATINRKRGKMLPRQAGDICSVSPEGHVLTDVWFIELKHHRSLQLMRFIFEADGKLMRFWEKTQEEAKAYDKSPMMIVKQNLLPILVLTPYENFPLTGPDIGLSIFELEHCDCQVRLFEDMVKP
jgi:hypothetical protein